MKAEMYYRETYPKEFRIHIANEDELRFLKLLFSLHPSGILKKFTKDELSIEDLTDSWKKSFQKKAELVRQMDDPYATAQVYDELEQEIGNIKMLEVSDVK